MIKALIVLFLFTLSLTGIAEPESQQETQKEAQIESQGELTFEPVSIKDSERSLESRIKFPKKMAKSKEDIGIVVRCDAFIKRNGKVKSNMCFEEGDLHYPFVTAINRATKSAVFNPGKVNGATTIVYYQYYVIFLKKGQSTSVEVVGNSGLEVEKYGTDYTSPQRYRESKGKFGAGCGHNKKITVNAIVSELGVVSDVAIVGNNLGEKCVKYMEKAFINQKFIPAFYQGKAVSAPYSEFMYNVMRGQ